jgi:lipid A 3-O-deacylase
MIRFVTVLMSLGLAVAPTPVAHAGGLVHELKLGVVAHDIPAIWSGFQLETRAVGLNAEAILTPSYAFLGGHFRPAVGGTLTIGEGGDTTRQTSKIYAGVRWIYESPRGWFAGLGIGGALHNGLLDATDPERKALGRRVLFHFPFELGYRLDGHHAVSLYFDHISNGYTKPVNEGLDTLGVRYGYKY